MTGQILVDRATIEQALEAMLNFPDDISDEMFESIRALRAALAQQPEPAQEPVAWMDIDSDGNRLSVRQWSDGNRDEVPLYTAPPQRPPLTDEEMLGIIDDAFEGASLLDVARAIERKVRGE